MLIRVVKLVKRVCSVKLIMVCHPVLVCFIKAIIDADQLERCGCCFLLLERNMAMCES